MDKQKQGGMKEEMKQIFVMSSTQRQQAKTTDNSRGLNKLLYSLPECSRTIKMDIPLQSTLAD